MNFKIDFGNTPESRDKLKELGVVWVNGLGIDSFNHERYLSISNNKASFFAEHEWVAFEADDNELLTQEEFYSL